MVSGIVNHELSKEIDIYSYSAKRAIEKTRASRLRKMEDQKIEIRKLIFKYIDDCTEDGKFSLEILKYPLPLKIPIPPADFSNPKPLTNWVDMDKMAYFCRTQEGQKWLKKLGYSLTEDADTITISWEDVNTSQVNQESE